MSTTSPTIPVETARHVLWRYARTGAARPGSFTQHLMDAIEAADFQNQAILRDAYPALSQALHLARYDEEGLTKLQRIAGVGPIRCTYCEDEDGPFKKATDGHVCETCLRAPEPDWSQQ
ncbi:hypothetical protein [Streptomyces lasiicapitis]|uniref:hypothetical protein n=1 Tax=Streptomyces lasiicapitis TaxID=1923961 RepID=UPI0036A7501C